MKAHSYKMPALSLLDKCLYNISFLLVFAVGVALALLYMLLCDYIAWSDPDTLAYVHRMNGFLVAPAILYFCVSCVIVLYAQKKKRRPIFGKKGVNYGPPLWEDIYPVFSKCSARSHPRKKMPSVEIKTRRRNIALWIGVFCLLLCLVPFSILGRKTVDTSGDFYIFNALGKQTECYTHEDIFSVLIECDREVENIHSDIWWLPMGYDWHCRILVTMEDGETFRFSLGNFVGENLAGLRGMLFLKSLVPKENIECRLDGDLEKLVQEYRMNEEETALLYELFDQQDY